MGKREAGMEVGQDQEMFWEGAHHHSGGGGLKFGGNDALSPASNPASLAALAPAPMPVPLAQRWLCLPPPPAPPQPCHCRALVLSCHCVFLPAPVPPILAFSSGCGVPSELSLQPADQIGFGPGHAATGQASAEPSFYCGGADRVGNQAGMLGVQLGTVGVLSTWTD